RRPGEIAMTSRLLVPFLLLAAACSGGASNENAAAGASTPPTTLATVPSPAGPTIAAEIVTIDPSPPSLTLREGDVPPLRAPGPPDIRRTARTIGVEAAAASNLAALKPGQKVQVTCSSAPMVVTGPAGAVPAGVASAAPPPAGASAPPAGTAATGP